MTKKKRHIDNNGGFEKESQEFLSKMEIPWKKDKEEIWDMLSEKIDKAETTQVKTIRLTWIKYAVAASIILLVGTAAFLRFHTQTISTLPGQQLAINLPDGSEVQLNSYSEIKYRTYRFNKNRSVSFIGEGFFKITPGKTFEVVGRHGTTKVLGTSFAIYDRKEEYKVTCLTGSVQVASKTSNKKVVLKPQDRAVVSHSGDVTKNENIDTKGSIAWLTKEFYYTSATLNHVFYEISLRYGVKIDIDPGILKSNRIYSGQFKQTESVEEVIGIVTKPLGLSYTKRNNKEYRITQN